MIHLLGLSWISDAERIPYLIFHNAVNMHAACLESLTSACSVRLKHESYEESYCWCGSDSRILNSLCLLYLVLQVSYCACNDIREISAE